MTDTPEQPEPDAPPPAPPPPSEPPPAAAQPALVRQHKLALPIMIGVGVLALLVAAFAVWQMQARPRGEDAYVVQPYTPPSEMIAARERAPKTGPPESAPPSVQAAATGRAGGCAACSVAAPRAPLPAAALSLTALLAFALRRRRVFR
jgi:MYXO-CTERM domain-containing protein